MRRSRQSGQPYEGSGDRYDELMARHQRLQAEVRRRIDAHMAELQRQLPLSGGTGRSFGASTPGIRLAPDGGLDAIVELRDPHGRVSEVTLRADPGGQVQQVSRPDPPPREPSLRPGDEEEERLAVVTDTARQHLPKRRPTTSWRL